MRISWKALGAIWAIVMAHGLCAMAALPTNGFIIPNDGTDLADEINRGTYPSLDIPAGTYSVTEPLYINRDLSLNGKPVGIPPLASEVIINQGAIPTGGCFGNTVKNGDFELGGTADWTETPSPIITNSTTAAHGGAYYALFSRAATAVTGVPDGTTQFKYGSPLDLTKFPLPPQITEQLLWNSATVPYKLSPFPVTLTQGQTVNVSPPGIYTETVTLYSGTAPFGNNCLMVWLYIPRYASATDKIVIKDNGLQSPGGIIITPVRTVPEISAATGTESSYTAAYNYVKVDLSTIASVGTHTITLEATLDADQDDPTIFLVGAAMVRSNAVSVTSDPVGSGTQLPLGAIAATVTSPLSPPYSAPTRLIPAGAVSTASEAARYSNAYGYPVLRFGGVGNPRAIFNAAMTRIGAPGDSIEPFYIYGATNVPVGTPLSAADLAPACRTFTAPLPVIPGKIGFKVNIDTATPAPTVFAIDDLIATIVSPTLETVSTLFAPKNFNLLTPAASPDFESGPGAWTVVPTAPAVLAMTDIVKPGPCSGNAALFDPLTMPAPPVNLYAWAKVAQGGTAGDTLTVTLTDGATTVTKQLLDGGTAVSADFAKLPPVDVTAYAGKTVVMTFTGLTGTGTATPAIFALGSAEFSNVPLTALDPVSPVDFSAFTQIEDAYLAANGLGAPPMTWPGVAPHVHPVRFGGFHQPTLKYQVSAPSKGDPADKLELLFADTAYPLLALTEVTANCLKKEDLVPTAWLGKSGGFGFRSTIKANAPGTETVFELDDLCLGYISDGLAALDAATFPPCDMALLKEDFEGGGTWTAEASFGPVASLIGPSTETPTPCDATNVAVFKAVPPPAVQTVTLAQTAIKVLPQTREISFYVKMPTGGTAFDKLECVTHFGGADATVFTLSGSDTGYAGYKQVTADMVLYAGNTVDLKFVATLADSNTPASFAVDDICLAPPPGLTALLTIGGGTATMYDINVSGGVTAIAVKNSATLNMYRCLVDKATAEGVQIAGASTGNIASCVFDGVPTGVNNLSGSVNVFQTTLLGGTTAVQGLGGTTKVAACLCADAGISGTGVTTYLNWVKGNNFTGEYATLKNLDAVNGVKPVFLNTPWKGKLDPAVMVQSGVTEGVLSSAGFAIPSQWATDYEGDARSNTNLGVGADQQFAGQAITSWSCSADRQVTGPNAAPVHIVIMTQGGDLRAVVGLRLRLAPERPFAGTPGNVSVDGNYLTVPVTADSPISGYADVYFPGTLFNGLCVDGVMTAGDLEVNGSPLNMPPTSICPFTVDTMPPVLRLDSLTVSPMTAMSGGSLLIMDVHALINTGSDPSLRYDDPRRPVAPMNCTITAGFTEQLQPLDANGAPCAVTPSGFASFADPNNASVLNNTTDVPGIARLGGVVSNIGEVTSASAVFSGTLTTLDASWAIENVLTNGDDPWNIAVKPVARDLANNESVVIDGNGNPVPLAHALKIWWMHRVMADFAQSSTSLQQTANPRFDWTLFPANRPPTLEAAPLQSRVWFQVWYGPTDTGPWTPLTDDWYSTASPFIDGSTPVVVVGATVLLSDALMQNRRNAQQGKTMLIALLGQDEAGNVQPRLTGQPVYFDQAGIRYRIWTNGQTQGNTAVDTELNVRLSYAKGAAEQSLGSITRVPLPSPDQSVRAWVSMTARYPEQMNSTGASGGVRVEWKLYEDGTLVAQGRVFPNPLNASMAFALPNVLTGDVSSVKNAELVLDAAPTPTAFLHANGRLGDESARQREIRYTLVAQTVAIVPTGVDTGNNIILQPLADPTPASVEFSIYPREALDKVREEQPVRIYERK